MGACLSNHEKTPKTSASKQTTQNGAPRKRDSGVTKAGTRGTSELQKTQNSMSTNGRSTNGKELGSEVAKAASQAASRGASEYHDYRSEASRSPSNLTASASEQYLYTQRIRFVHIKLNDSETLGIRWKGLGDEMGSIIVDSVEEDSPASYAGAEPNWRLLDIDGHTISTHEELAAAVEKMKRHSGGSLRMSPTYTRDEVSLKTDAEDAWLIIAGQVYNVTPFLHKHPGGYNTLIRHAGTDATTQFERIHSAKAHTLLKKYSIGFLRDCEAESKTRRE
ncbi:Cytochrome b5 [Diplonema papillatum]|nr:Cytochrome b5 [Diplonema papillatum]